MNIVLYYISIDVCASAESRQVRQAGLPRVARRVRRV